MGGKPRKNKQIAVNYKTHQKLETEAIENDKTIKEVAEERIHNNNQEEINRLSNRIEDCEKSRSKLNGRIDELKKKNHRLKKELEKQSGKKWKNYEEVPREDFEEAMKKRISGVGEKKASKFFDALTDEVKIVTPKDL